MSQSQLPVTDLYDPKTFDPRTGIGRLIGLVRAELSEALDRELAPFDITAAQYVILVRLASGEVDSASGLCKGVAYDPGAMTRMIDRLERKQLVVWTRSPNDRRKVMLQMTDAGREIYPRLVEKAAGAMNVLMRGFTKAEVLQLEGLLQRILMNT